MKETLTARQSGPYIGDYQRQDQTRAELPPNDGFFFSSLKKRPLSQVN